jgi:large subunit ribosomal protein L17
MRHLNAGRTLGVKPAHRRAMLRNLVTSLLEQGRIRTTLARAKELRTPLDQMITLGKRGDLTARRRALTFVKSKAAMAGLFGELAERYKERPGGFSRILHTAPRRGDGAEMALVVLVGAEQDPFVEDSKPSRRRARKPRPALEQVAERVRGEGVPTASAEGPSSKAASRAEAPVQDAPASESEDKPEGQER